MTLDHDNAVEQVWAFCAEHPEVLDADGTINAHFAEAAVQVDDLEAGYALWQHDLAVLDQAVQSPLDRAADSIARQLRDEVKR